VSQGTDPKGNDSSATTLDAIHKCQSAGVLDCRFVVGYGGGCNAGAATPDGRYTEVHGGDVTTARSNAFLACNSRYGINNCHIIFGVCDTPNAFSLGVASKNHPAFQPDSFSPIRWLDTNAFTKGLSFGFALIVVLLIFARRQSIANFIIHGRLPYELAAYGESIQVLFKRTQRVNWYGRIVFGIVANLSMTKDHLTKVRRYWLGRVIAFDSLRRQRQNELARMHFQLATSVKTEPKDKTALSQLWSVIKFFLLFFFYLLRAIFSFVFGFLFIRVNIAKLVRGTIIESKDLTLILQAKEAIEESASYLKEYLATADTFDGRDEVV
jgi:hypothetical protein